MEHSENTAAGVVTLGQLRRRGMGVLEVACSRCDRRGRYRVETLIARFGSGMGLPELAAMLSAECPRRARGWGSVDISDRCDVYYPHLARPQSL